MNDPMNPRASQGTRLDYRIDTHVQPVMLERGWRHVYLHTNADGSARVVVFPAVALARVLEVENGRATGAARWVTVESNDAGELELAGDERMCVLRPDEPVPALAVLLDQLAPNHPARGSAASR